MEMVCWAGVLCLAFLPPQGTHKVLLGPDLTQEFLGWI